MPYIKEDDREKTAYRHVMDYPPTLRDSIDEVINQLEEFHIHDRYGATNYAISRIVAGALLPEDNIPYYLLNAAHGTFYSAAAEFYRRLGGPKEDQAIEDNGDIQEYERYFDDQRNINNNK